MKIRNLCIVRFGYERYAVRKGILSYQYLDLEDPTNMLWYCKYDEFFVDYCLTDSLSTARKKLKELKEGTRYKNYEEVIEK